MRALVCDRDRPGEVGGSPGRRTVLARAGMIVGMTAARKVRMYRLVDGVWSLDTEDSNDIEEQGWERTGGFTGEGAPVGLVLYIRRDGEPGLIVGLREPFAYGDLEYWRFESWLEAGDTLAKWTSVLRDMALMDAFDPEEADMRFNARGPLEHLAARWEWGRTEGLHQQKNQRREQRR